jgi:hypothetical protein
MSIQTHTSLSVRVPIELSEAVKAVVAHRTAEDPFRRYSLGDAIRELLSRGLMSFAKEVSKK